MICFLLLFRRAHNAASVPIFYRNFYGIWSSEFSNCMPPPLSRPRWIRILTYVHLYSVQLPDAKVDSLFIPGTG